jgi:hypothetical protein
MRAWDDRDASQSGHCRFGTVNDWSGSEWDISSPLQGPGLAGGLALARRRLGGTRPSVVLILSEKAGMFRFSAFGTPFAPSDESEERSEIPLKFTTPSPINELWGCCTAP